MIMKRDVKTTAREIIKVITVRLKAAGMILETSMREIRMTVVALIMLMIVTIMAVIMGMSVMEEKSLRKMKKMSGN